ncbi:hypothetical protein AIOL_004661 [Candidatus Rhodobacter oscarellae]|uniref:Uncharacterized protein n=1 Tax=Candidatus Rhodobacter oscarellae TaxID=1675527 RepID=A0A0J9ED76_9RHOB|nr:hypothetical protein [Candidatus Rhodobacter lobularis]KMW59679.1 hypothetical protein AIOL_004661 [Candidatus Rhodobacter lobularis]
MLKSTLTTLALFATTNMAAANGAPMSFDVAEDLSLFIFASEPVFEDGMPAFGNAFVTQGYIYEDGTLDGGAEGTLADGSPAYPDKVIGRWTCDGFFVGDGARTTTGAMVITRQVFEFENGDILINQGAELADIGVEAPRAITGGTGSFANITGEMSQVLLGMTDGFGVRLSIDIPSREQAAMNDPHVDETDHAEWDSGFPVGPLN